MGVGQVAQGLLYIWPEAGPPAALAAASKKPNLLPWIDEQVGLHAAFALQHTICISVAMRCLLQCAQTPAALVSMPDCESRTCACLQDVTKTRDGKPVTTVFKGFQRDMPLSYEHQMENLCDPVRAVFFFLACRARAHPRFCRQLIMRAPPPVLLRAESSCSHSTVAHHRCMQAHFNFVHHGVGGDR